MPRYKVTAPDGRTIVISGPSAPTDADLEEVFKGLPANDAGKGQESPQPRVRRAPTLEEQGEITALPEDSLMTKLRESLSPLIGNTDRQKEIARSKRAFFGMEDMPEPLYERGVVPAVTKALREPAATSVRVGGSVLGSEGGPTGAIINALGEKAGQIVGGEENDNGRTAQAALMGAIPLGSNAGMLAKIKNAAKMAGGGYAGEELRAAIDGDEAHSGRAALIGGGSSLGASALGKILAMVRGTATAEDIAKMAEKRLNNAETADSITRLTDKGAVINPASQNPGLINNTLGSLAGLQNIANKAKAINAPVINAEARAEASLLPTDRLNEDALEVARRRIMHPLNQLRSMGLGDEVDVWQKANQARQDLLEMRTAGTIGPADFRNQLAGVQASMRSTEQTIDAAANKAGKPELVGILPQVQEKLAKNYDVRRVVPTGTGHVNADAVSGLAAQRVDSPAQLTGGLRDIAKFNNAAYNAAGDVNQLAPHSGTLGPHAALGAAAVGTGPKALASAGIMGLRGPIADFLLSPKYQAGKGLLGTLSGGAKPSYRPPTTSDPEIEKLMTRIMVMLQNLPQEQEQPAAQ